MALSPQVLDRLFDRLTATYGRDFMGRWEGLDANAVRASWAHELGGFERHLHVIAWALENLPERAPNVIEFRALCRRAPAAAVPRIEHQPADPQRVADELAKLRAVQSEPARAWAGGREWARSVLARCQAGDKVSPTVAGMARAALGMES